MEQDPRFLPNRRRPLMIIAIVALALTAVLFVWLRPAAQEPRPSTGAAPPTGAGKSYSQFSPGEKQATNSGQRRQPGDQAPRAKLTAINGGPEIITPRPGRAQVLEFIATWCQYCQKMTPILSQELRQAGNTELVVVGAARESDQQLRQFVNKFSTPGSKPLVANDRQLALADQYQLAGYPTIVFINKRGKITSIIVGAQQRSLIRAAIADNRG